MSDNPRTVYNTGLGFMLRGAQMIRSAARDGADVDTNVKNKADIVVGVLPGHAVRTFDELLLSHISQEPGTAKDLAERVGVSGGRVLSGTLTSLEKRRLIVGTQEGRWIVYHRANRLREAA